MYTREERMIAIELCEFKVGKGSGRGFGDSGEHTTQLAKEVYLEGDKTKTATLEEEVKTLRLENAELKMERDMLKKAAVYVCPEEPTSRFKLY